MSTALEMPLRTCRACGADISHRDKRARFCNESCAKRRPCLRCGGPKPPETKKGGRFCPPCQDIVNSKDYQRDLERQAAKRKRLRKLETGEYQGRRRAADTPAGHKWCAQCQTFLPVASFTQGADKLNAYCIPCTKDYNHSASLMRQFGITAERYVELLEIQDGRCAICLTRPRKRRLAVDHDHKTGEIRGLLCTRCNHGILGKAYDSDKMLTRAVGYLRKPPARTGKPVPQWKLEQEDLEFIEDQLPFLKDGAIAKHPGRGLVAVTPRSFAALTQAAGWTLIVDGVRLTPPKQLAIDDYALLEQLHTASTDEKVG